MRSSLQLAIIAMLAGAGVAWHLYGESYGLPRPLALLGLEAPAPAQATRGGGGAVGVVVQPARIGLVVERAESVGTVRAREAVTISTKVSGIVTTIGFQEGQMVKQGDELVNLDAAALRAEMDQARALMDDARMQLRRAQQLQPGQTIAASRLDTLESLSRQAEGRMRQAQAKLEEMRITAPFSGRVGLRQVSLGALIQPGTAITTLDDITTVRVEFSMPEVFLASARIGATVTARTAAYGDRRFVGRVLVVDTRIDPATRSIRLISEFDNPDEALKPGLFLSVELELHRRADAVLVAEEAIDPVGDRAYLYVVRDGRAKRVEVALGARLPGEVEVTRGVTAGEQIVVRGIQRLRHDAPVRITETLAPPVS
ncbi:membrane fusion protein (multidrug efflux system) [Humitalea rosea]|uniref:Membrane fusion protein (Multidrug efflux system) n=1 Tax=Humitalea rosea TaxID=990373 RepID=A0A2W7IUR6_9PROT|nr:efflux RND transporter periplasmic adaptor subunit [Humitalea rosea]PZW51184.1 membrane fusion protein (multidrug efflux system) [Humitalea rosea]